MSYGILSTRNEAKRYYEKVVTVRQLLFRQYSCIEAFESNKSAKEDTLFAPDLTGTSKRRMFLSLFIAKCITVPHFVYSITYI